jgi:hypothetical protein
LNAPVIARVRTRLDGTAGGRTPGGFDPHQPADEIGLIILGLAMMGWLTWLSFHIHRRIFSQDRSVQKTEEALPVSDS